MTYDERRLRNKLRMRKWRATNPEASREHVRKYRAAHRAECQAASRQWRANNPDKQNLACSRWRKNNPDKVKRMQKAWYAANREQVLKRRRELRAKNRRAHLIKDRERRRQTKLRLVDVMGGKCSDCGFDRYPEALEFDHFDGNKEKSIGSLMSGSFTKLMREAKKCQLVCSNCHKARHYERTTRLHAA